ncbi:MAG: HNH endonuclease [Allobaculum sp.]|uniref:HNH endonuclease n=1 Tax=Allobaculum sp. TaxID=1872463 RepID=UPI0039996F15
MTKRDKVCQHCGATDNLQVHHISHWSDDPVNRINPDNGILLCKNTIGRNIQN